MSVIRKILWVSPDWAEFELSCGHTQILGIHEAKIIRVGDAFKCWHQEESQDEEADVCMCTNCRKARGE